MTKGEIIQFLEPFSDEIEIRTLFPGNDEFPMSIKHATYVLEEDGTGMAVLTPMGAHFNLEEKGTCVCIERPIGEGGLEGYILNNSYPYRKKLNTQSKWFFEVRPSPDHDYWESCKPRIFNRFFKIRRRTHV